MQSVPNQQELKQDMHNCFQQPPTYTEFESAIRHINTNTAPDMSNLTNNEIKSWHDQIKRTAYEALSELWEIHTIPDDWSWRYLCLKPKTSDPHLTATDLRPLTLIDCLRKLWGKVILHRINQQWHTHHTLSTLQHCEKGRGTDSALLQRSATAEAAGFNLYTSSWDFRKAFDSVSKPIIKLAWSRLGVPTDVVEWIATLDQDPHLIHLTEAHWHPNNNTPLHTQYSQHPDPPTYLTAV
eukprot:gene42118-biopygen5466